MLVTVDARLARSSGIGTYLRQVVPRVFDPTQTYSGALLGDPAELQGFGTPERAFLSVHPCAAPLYSIREQLEVPRATPPATDLFWSPHYNVPVLYRGPLLVTVHDVLHLSKPEFVKGFHRRLYARRMFDIVRRRASAVICDSHFTADELIRHAAVPTDRISVIHLGVEPAWFEGPGAEPPGSTPYFVYVGNVKPHKNLVRLVRAFRLLAAELPHELVIVGRRHGFITGDTAVAAEAERLGSRIRFTDELTDEEVRRVVRKADALVLPSLYEGFGLPALEGMAAGCPVIVSRTASLPEVCGSAAVYFDPTDERELATQMKRVATDTALKRELVAAGRERARSFTWDRCAEETRQVIEGVLAR